MNSKQNLHTHTIYCDGSDTPKEMVEAAIELGFKSIGFSGHSNMRQLIKWCMTEEAEREYFTEVNRLKKEYKDKIEIFCGVEYDIYSGRELSGYDYSIGSVHGFMIDGKYVDFDISQDGVGAIIKDYFDGDGMKYAKKYYETVAGIPQYGKFDIIGHFDIVAKHCEKVGFFDVNSKEYLSYAFEAADALRDKIKLFEVNTGAIARGYRTTPYPSIPILRELKKMGFGAVIASDCHNKSMLDCCYEEAKELLELCGFKSKYILTADGFKEVEL